MSDLTLEQCKNLDKWGMDLKGFGSPRRGYYKIPSLEELMEFAKILDECWHIAPCPNGWVITRMTETGMFIEELIDPAPKQAVYKLIEKVKDE